MRLLSSSVRVFRGVEDTPDDRVILDGAGITMEGMLMGGAECAE